MVVVVVVVMVVVFCLLFLFVCFLVSLFSRNCPQIKLDTSGYEDVLT